MTESKIKNWNANFILLLFAGFCLSLALMIAWVLGITLFYPDGSLAHQLVDRSDIIKAHIDFLMMSQFLFIFFLLFRQQAIQPPYWVVAACCFGAFFNPLSFLMRGLHQKPDPALLAAVEPHFPPQAALSFSLITIGFLASVFLVAKAMWKENQQGVQ